MFFCLSAILDKGVYTKKVLVYRYRAECLRGHFLVLDFGRHETFSGARAHLMYCCATGNGQMSPFRCKLEPLKGGNTLADSSDLSDTPKQKDSNAAMQTAYDDGQCQEEYSV